MITQEELDDDFEEEVKEECESKYGPVKEVLVYMEKQSEEDDAEIIIKVFVEFSLSETAKVYFGQLEVKKFEKKNRKKFFENFLPPPLIIAKNQLHGRWFGGKQITAHFYNMGFYEADDLSQ